MKSRINICVTGDITRDVSVAVIPEKEYNNNIANISYQPGSSLLAFWILFEILNEFTKLPDPWSLTRDQRPAHSLGYYFLLKSSSDNGKAGSYEANLKIRRAAFRDSLKNCKNYWFEDHEKMEGNGKSSPGGRRDGHVGLRPWNELLDTIHVEVDTFIQFTHVRLLSSQDSRPRVKSDQTLIDWRNGFITEWGNWRRSIVVDSVSPTADDVSSIERKQELLRSKSWRTDLHLGWFSNRIAKSQGETYEVVNDDETSKPRHVVLLITNDTGDFPGKVVRTSNACAWEECLKRSSQSESPRPTFVIYKWWYDGGAAACSGGRVVDSNQAGTAGKSHGRRLLEALKDFGPNAIVILRARDLRERGMILSRGVSWERTCIDFMEELARLDPLTDDSDIQSLAGKVSLIVSFGPCANILCVPTAKTHEDLGPGDTRGRSASGHSYLTRLIFDRERLEDDWANDFPGATYGGHALLTAVVTKRLADLCTNDEALAAKDHEFSNALLEQLTSAVRDGMAGTRYLYVAGFSDQAPFEDSNTDLGFPYEQIGVIFRGDRECNTRYVEGKVVGKNGLQEYARKALSQVDLQPRLDRSWAILDDEAGSEQTVELAIQIGREGLRALAHVPVSSIGKLKVFDRREVEAYSAIRDLISNYLERPVSPRPLSFAVFGQPGSGKSFAIRELAGALRFVRPIKVLEFNLSQFKSVDDLARALHEVRNATFAKTVPLAIWDEFDCRHTDGPLTWPKHFLVPMQDGWFLEQQVAHPIGDAIFVFAGGVYHSFQEFEERGAALEADRKIPDFISRLRGYVDILGANPCESAVGRPGEVPDRYLLRRASMLYTFLKQRHERSLCPLGTLRIHPAVLNAFLFVKRYKHGFRSMEAILDMCRLHDATSFTPACLPAEEQLIGHVNPNDFMDYVLGRKPFSAS